MRGLRGKAARHKRALIKKIDAGEPGRWGRGGTACKFGQV